MQMANVAHGRSSFGATALSQGVSSIDYIWVGPKDTATHNAEGFAVANWSYAPAGTSGNPDFPYFDEYSGSRIDVAGTGYAWLSSEVSDGAGLAGQGTANPASLFNNHQFLKNNHRFSHQVLRPIIWHNLQQSG